MPKLRISEKEIKQIISLRRTGHSLPEIQKIVKRGNSTVFKYIQGVLVLPKYRQILKDKQGGSKEKSRKDWKAASKKAKDIFGEVDSKTKLVILTCLYWGEGNKTELNLNNSDPALIKTFVQCLYGIGVKKSDLRITLRLFEDIKIEEAKLFWANLLDIKVNEILGINIIHGKKVGKLKYGMCRVRVTKGGPHFKLIMSMIDLIKSDFNAAVVQRIEQDTPNV